MKWKVCGMRDPQNITKVLELSPDFMGFIFYEKSPRYVGHTWEGPGLDFPKETKKVGVFVNEKPGKILQLADQYGISWIQLHGHESPEACQQLKHQGYSLIKAVSINHSDDFKRLSAYKPWVNYFLFDTPGTNYGGTGRTFDWSLLNSYDNQLPIFLSGGLSLENIEGVVELKKMKLEVLDVNSRFEITPGIKDYNMLKKLKEQINKL
jgi:phosphoribosylanthranilate isomerase